MPSVRKYDFHFAQQIFSLYSFHHLELEKLIFCKMEMAYSSRKIIHIKVFPFLRLYMFLHYYIGDTQSQKIQVTS